MRVPLSAILRVDLDILALLVAGGLIVFLYRHVGITKNLKGHSTQDGLVSRHGGVFQNTIACFPENRFDLELGSLQCE